jgi:transcriptional regulator with GAF, ATPase, and Fis domain
MDAELFDPRTAFAELGRIMLGVQDLNQTLQRIADLARKTIPEIDEVSVTLVDGGQPKTVVFTGQLAVQLDERQYETANGPCLDAAVSGETIVIDSSDVNTEYPEFASAARRQGVTHSLSIGLPVPQRVVGALNLYASTSEAIRPDTVAQAQAFASYAGVSLASAALYTSTAELAEQMRTGMQTRSSSSKPKGSSWNAMATVTTPCSKPCARYPSAAIGSCATLRQPSSSPLARRSSTSTATGHVQKIQAARQAARSVKPN